jgi:putative ABC transport system permease protein
MIADLRHTLRSMLRNPTVTLFAVVTLALGIGANTAIFSAVSAFLFRPLPFLEPDRLLHLFQTDPERGWTELRFSLPEYQELEQRTTGFDRLAIYDYVINNLTDDRSPERVHASRISASVLSTLGVEPALGRGFLEREQVPGHSGVVILSHRFWRSRYAGDREILGHEVRLDGRPYTVVGVMPEGFQFPYPQVAMWVPLVSDTTAFPATNRRFLVFGRLAPGETPESALEKLTAAHRRVQDEVLESDRELGVRTVSMRQALTFSFDLVRLTGLVLMVAVALVLLIACANVANLLLAQAAARRPELALRASLGASRPRLLRQMLLESLVLALLGGVLGVALAVWGLGLLRPMIPMELYRVGDLRVDAVALAFTTALSLVTAVVFGLAPALRSSRTELSGVLHEGSRSTTTSRTSRRFHSVLVVAQLGLALVLLISAAIMIRSLVRIHEIDPGLKADGVLTLGMSLSKAEYPEPYQVEAFYRDLLSSAERVPGVRTAALVYPLPLNYDTLSRDFAIEGRASAPDERLYANEITVSSGYFETLGVPLIRGRTFTQEDDAESPPVVIVNRTLAERHWPGGDPLGERLLFGATPEERRALTIVGVVGDVKDQGLTEPVLPQVYLPLLQDLLWGGHLVVATTRPPMGLVQPLRTAAREIDPGLPFSEVRTMEEVIADSSLSTRITVRLLSVLGLGALVLAVAGLYGLMAYLVVQRKRELAIRMALGARPGQVVSLVVRHGARLVLLGIAIGLPAAIGLSRALQGFLFGFGEIDLVVFLGTPAFLALIAAGAAYLPARRATRIDPQEAIRNA